jgi:hypothetical protein
MSGFEQAHEHLEHTAHEHHAEHGKGHARAAIIIAIMAAALALTEFAGKDAQTEYLTNHIAASDTWAQYQAKSIRRTVLASEAEILEGLSSKPDSVLEKKIADARANADRMKSEPGADGMDQLAEKAKEEEHLRDHAMHSGHILEIASGGLQIAIVLASISVVIELPALLMGSLALGIASAAYALMGGFSVL